MQHHVLPGDRLVQLELYLVHLVPRLHVDEEVCVVEDRVHQQVRTVLDVVDPARRGLDEHVLAHSSLALLQQHPAVHPLPQVQIRRQLVRLVVVDGQRLLRQLLLDLQLGLDHRLVEGAVRDPLGEDGLI